MPAQDCFHSTSTSVYYGEIIDLVEAVSLSVRKLLMQVRLSIEKWQVTWVSDGIAENWGVQGRVKIVIVYRIKIMGRMNLVCDGILVFLLI